MSEDTPFRRVRAFLQLQAARPGRVRLGAARTGTYARRARNTRRHGARMTVRSVCVWALLASISLALFLAIAFDSRATRSDTPPPVSDLPALGPPASRRLDMRRGNVPSPADPASRSPETAQPDANDGHLRAPDRAVGQTASSSGTDPATGRSSSTPSTGRRSGRSGDASGATSAAGDGQPAPPNPPVTVAPPPTLRNPPVTVAPPPTPPSPPVTVAPRPTPPPTPRPTPLPPEPVPPRPLPTPPSDGSTVTVRRFAAIESPNEVAPLQEFALIVSLSESNSTPEVRIQSGNRTDDGQLALPLPTSGRDRGWDIDVIISASAMGFRKGVNTGTLHLTEKGDSTPLAFWLTPTADGPPVRTIYVTFWHESGFLGKVARDVTLSPAERRRSASEVVSPGVASPAVASPAQRIATSPLDFSTDADEPDLTLWENPDSGEVWIKTRRLQPIRGTFDASVREIRAWVERELPSAPLLNRSLVPTQSTAPVTRNRLEGFGRELYRRFAPRAFKDAYSRLRQALGDEFDSILIISSDPAVPWELMIPTDGPPTARFLGVDFKLGRWHSSRTSDIGERPPQALVLDGIVVMAPAYPPARALVAQTVEVEFLRGLPGYRAGPRRLKDVLGLIADAPAAIVHFAGHGQGPRDAATGGGALVFEDGEIDPISWRGAMDRAATRRYPLVFLNACDVGQARGRTNFVEGWAPTLLESGASGFIGGLWPVSDSSAAEFAQDFYRRLTGSSGRPVSVAEALRATRARFYENGDPTFLAYAYYGDPNLTVSLRADAR